MLVVCSTLCFLTCLLLNWSPVNYGVGGVFSIVFSDLFVIELVTGEVLFWWCV